MGEADSWSSELMEMGFAVECPMTTIDGKEYFKGLAYYPEVNEGFLNRLQRALELARYY